LEKTERQKAADWLKLTLLFVVVAVVAVAVFDVVDEEEDATQFAPFCESAEAIQTLPLSAVRLMIDAQMRLQWLMMTMMTWKCWSSHHHLAHRHLHQPHALHRVVHVHSCGWQLNWLVAAGQGGRRQFDQKTETRAP